jgi:hypothetical protein
VAACRERDKYPLQIFVTIPSDKHTIPSSEPTERIEDIRVILHDKDGHPPKSFRLVVGVNILGEGKTLSIIQSQRAAH